MSSETNSEIRIIAAQRIREERKAKGLTIDKLAEKTGLSIQSIKQIEAGKRNFRIETLVALADCLGVSCDYIVGKEDNKNEKKLHILLSRFNHEEVGYLLSLLEQFRCFLATMEEDTNNDLDSDL